MLKWNDFKEQHILWDLKKANFFFKGPDGKYFWFGGPYGLS